LGSGWGWQMSDLPDLVWVKLDGDDMDFSAPGYGKEYLRADLAPVIGYSLEQMREAMIRCDISDNKIDDIIRECANVAKFPQPHLATLTPAAKDPAMLVEALERIAKQDLCFLDSGVAFDLRETAREALRQWRDGR
jgi:hypothetical protein